MFYNFLNELSMLDNTLQIIDPLFSELSLNQDKSVVFLSWIISSLI
jgi:hypothetical protein